MIFLEYEKRGQSMVFYVIALIEARHLFLFARLANKDKSFLSGIHIFRRKQSRLPIQALFFKFLSLRETDASSCPI